MSSASSRRDAEVWHRGSRRDAERVEDSLYERLRRVLQEARDEAALAPALERWTDASQLPDDAGHPRDNRCSRTSRSHHVRARPRRPRSQGARSPDTAKVVLGKRISEPDFTVHVALRTAVEFRDRVTASPLDVASALAAHV